MKKITYFFALTILIFSCSRKEKVEKKEPLTLDAKSRIITELKEMKKTDQLNRTFISIGTFNEELIDSVNELSLEDRILFNQSFQKEISKAQDDSLWIIQREYDLQNTNRLISIINKYGWPDKELLGSEVNPMVFLFHTPKESINEMTVLLYEEVQEKRMKPIQYATFVDNMRKKAYGKSQLYGTGDEFDPATRSIEPPYIENIDSTNLERQKIGLPELKEGEYRTSK